MANMGLRSSLNDDVSKPAGNNNTNVSADRQTAIELFDIPADGIIKKHTKKDIMLPMSVSDQEYINKCMDKFGCDYVKMSRDIKINNYQHNKNSLRKMGEKFLALSKKDRVVEVSEKVAKWIVAESEEEGEESE